MEMNVSWSPSSLCRRLERGDLIWKISDLETPVVEECSTNLLTNTEGMDGGQGGYSTVDGFRKASIAPLSLPQVLALLVHFVLLSLVCYTLLISGISNEWNLFGVDGLPTLIWFVSYNPRIIYPLALHKLMKEIDVVEDASFKAPSEFAVRAVDML